MFEKKIKSILDSLHLNYKFEKLDIIEINDFCNLDNLHAGAITWIKDYDAEMDGIIAENKNTLFFVSYEFYKKGFTNVIFVKNIKSSFFKVVKILFENINIENKIPKIEDTAIVLTDNYGDSVYIGHGTFIDKNVNIGDNVTIMNNVTIQGEVVIGNNCFIESGAIIGVCGYGLYENENQTPVILPHLGKVIIGNDVRIGAATCIARGCLCDTRIEDGVKIDNLCHIAHNVVINKNAKIVACSELSGGVVIGEGAWVAPNTSIKQHCVLGKNVYTGLASNILNDVPEGALIYGNPGRIKEKK